ncbi:MAG: histidine phosphatase family protein [Acetatifactor sp.]|nr:histidine phosphatase family protein [Acetatifactor sp.]
MKILFLRHGATAGNEMRRYIGRTDEPLSPQGIRQAEAAGKIPVLSLVYVTPLLRTRQTAEIMFPNARQVTVEDLREMDFGDFEGKNAQEMESDRLYRDWVDGNCMGQCPGGESRDAFADRVQTAFERTVIFHMSSGMDSTAVLETDSRIGSITVLETNSRIGSEAVVATDSRMDILVFVVHGGTIMAVLEKFARPTMTFYEGHVGNCQGFLCTLSSPAAGDEFPFVLTEITKIDKVIL